MFYKIFLILTLFINSSLAQGLFDFFSGEQTPESPIRSRDIDINEDERTSVRKVKREETVIEFIPYVTYGYSRLNLDYDNSSNKTETIDSKLEFGITLNTSFNYFANTNFGYMLNFNYETYSFDEDEIGGSVKTDISGNIIKTAPLLFYSFDINRVSVYLGLGYGLAKYNLSGTNNYNEKLTIDDFSLLSIYKLELLYGRYIITLLQEESNVSGSGFESELNETHVNLGYLISF